MAEQAEIAQNVVTAVEKSSILQSYITHHVQNSFHWSIGGWKLDLPGFLPLHALMALIATGILFWLFIVRYDRSRKAPRGLTNALETMVVFVRDEICFAYLGKEDGRRMAPLFLNFFFFILVLNIMGLMPWFATATGNFFVTMVLGLVVFLFMTVGAIIKNGPGKFMSAFIPHGLPMPILFLVVPLEVLGVFVKSGVLALRLFANMMAGHLALFNILALILMFKIYVAPFILGLGLFVYLLEILVAFLQAYIFTMLSAMFIGQIYHPEH